MNLNIKNEHEIHNGFFFINLHHKEGNKASKKQGVTESDGNWENVTGVGWQ